VSTCPPPPPTSVTPARLLASVPSTRVGSVSGWIEPPTPGFSGLVAPHPKVPSPAVMCTKSSACAVSCIPVWAPIPTDASDGPGTIWARCAGPHRAPRSRGCTRGFQMLNPELRSNINSDLQIIVPGSCPPGPCRERGGTWSIAKPDPLHRSSSRGACAGREALPCSCRRPPAWLPRSGAPPRTAGRGGPVCSTCPPGILPHRAKIQDRRLHGVTGLLRIVGPAQ
jgi:hypothetical protein